MFLIVFSISFIIALFIFFLGSLGCVYSSFRSMVSSILFTLDFLDIIFFLAYLHNGKFFFLLQLRQVALPGYSSLVGACVNLECIALLPFRVSIVKSAVILMASPLCD